MLNLKLYILPNDLRGTLRDMHKLMENSVVIKGSHRDVVNAIRSIIGSANIWAIGDVICSSLIKYGIIPRVCVFDERTQREPTHESIDLSKFNKVIEVMNPRGTISEDTLNKLRHIAKIDERIAVRVIGEEDLLALAALIVASINSYIAYGLPKKGAVLIPVTSNNKKVAKDLLKRFEMMEVHSGPL